MTNDKIRVIIRIRPLNERERQEGQYEAWQAQSQGYIYPVSRDGRPIPSSSGHVFGIFPPHPFINNNYINYYVCVY